MTRNTLTIAAATIAADLGYRLKVRPAVRRRLGLAPMPGIGPLIPPACETVACEVPPTAGDTLTADLSRRARESQERAARGKAIAAGSQSPPPIRRTFTRPYWADE